MSPGSTLGSLKIYIMTRAEIEAEIGRLLGDVRHTRWSVGTLRSREEMAQKEVQVLTGAVKTVDTLTPVAETREVEVDSSVIDVVRVTLTDSDGVVTPLTGRGRLDLDYYLPNWENKDSGKPEVFSWDASEQDLLLIPKPSSDYAIADALKVWEVRTPAPMTSDTSEPFDANVLMVPFHMSIVHWVVAQCFMDDGNAEALGKSKFHKSGLMDRPGEYEKQLKKINARFDSPTSIPQRIKWTPQGGRLAGTQSPTKSYPWG